MPKSLAIHCPIVADVMTEWSQDYYPSQRFIEEPVEVVTVIVSEMAVTHSKGTLTVYRRDSKEQVNARLQDMIALADRF